MQKGNYDFKNARRISKDPLNTSGHFFKAGVPYLKEDQSAFEKDHLSPVTSSCSIRFCREGTLGVPLTRDIFLLGFRKYASSAVAPALWNVFPSEIRLDPSILIFQEALKTLSSAARHGVSRELRFVLMAPFAEESYLSSCHHPGLVFLFV